MNVGSLWVDVGEFYHRVGRAGKGTAAEKVGCGIVGRQHLPLFVACHGCKLGQIAYEQQLHTAERQLVAAVMA